jgi:hypothetical protein
MSNDEAINLTTGGHPSIIEPVSQDRDTTASAAQQERIGEEHVRLIKARIKLRFYKTVDILTLALSIVVIFWAL